MIGGWMLRLAPLVLAALALPGAALAQIAADPPDIAAKKQQIFNAPLDQRAALGDELLALIARHHGVDSDAYAAQLMLHATDLNFARRSAEAQQAMERAIAILTRLHGPDHIATARAQRDYAATLIINGFRDRAEAPYRAYIAAMTEEAYGCGRIKQVPGGRMVMGCATDEKDLGDDLVGYGQLLVDLDRPDDAVAAFEAVIARFQPRWDGCGGAEWGTRCDRAAFNRRDFMNDFAGFLVRIGRGERGRAIFRDNLLPRLEALPGCAADDCRADYWLLRDYGRYRAALAASDAGAARAFDARWLPVLAADPAYARGAADDAASDDRDYRRDVGEIAAAYAKDAIAAGQASPARALLEPLGLAELVAAGQDDAARAARLAALESDHDARSYSDHDGRAAIRREQADLLRAWHGETSAEYGDALRAVALDLRAAGDPAATEDYFRRSLAVFRTGFGDDHFRTLNALSYLSDWLADQGRKSDAATILAEVLAAPANDQSEVYADPVRAALLASGLGALNDPHGTLNELKSDLARLTIETGGDIGTALAAARHAATGKRAWRRSFGFSLGDEAAYDMAIDDNFLFNVGHPYAGYFTLFADALWAADARGAAAAEEAFLALQEAQMGTTSRAVAKAAAERTLAQAGVSALLTERKAVDADAARLEQESRFITAADEQERQRLIRLNLGAQQRLAFRRTEIDQAIARAAPGYFELVRPQALSLADARALLAPDEALLMIVPTAFGTHSLLVTRDGIDWHRSALTEGELAGHVRRLLWDVGASIDVTAQEEERWSMEGEGDFPFDRATAWRLYEQLIAPIEGGLAGKRHLFTASSGALSSLPLGILVTRPPAGIDGDPAALRATPWFADKVALLQLPSLQSLQLLRAVGDRNEARAGTAMVGFGDPLLDGASAPRGIGGRNRGTRSGVGLSISAGLQPAAGDGPPLADPAALRRLARLPGTEKELKAMQALLGTDAARLYLADSATETNVKRGKLTGLSVLFLATHGLVAGEIGSVAEPGLVFTPPRTATAADDGLLTASEITGLDLGARWVILSACNTAAGDGSQGAPGLSGLARSFFFAGAESLLASHWPVRDDVASVLTVRLFELMRENPGLSRAEALQRAMREVRDDPRSDPFLNSWAHPSAWAPFSLIGDGID
ncbi:MAG: CHAT domain-containing tetratricopeptide repeat protein [Sphingopyxis sp.]|uniref:CHAT domain-containing tetratricopeptide repeat protein n=1 Tax=Sphingopyxis sp. TaxID=1908224 RepID=UPI002AB8A179|nr:CHAT domain-containing tetratricopeptide repeat protein [Sphingopyxis sp.]MDZ3831229.1 CHAT domain-containing tetratricopeptide repeat protein [Sphingopyxis sp.]